MLGFTSFNPTYTVVQMMIKAELNEPDASKTHWIGIQREKGAGLIFLMLNQRDLDLLMLSPSQLTTRR
jgi:hypothetical protein